MLCICYKEKSPDEGLGIYLSVGIMLSTQNTVRKYPAKSDRGRFSSKIHELTSPRELATFPVPVLISLLLRLLLFLGSLQNTFLLFFLINFPPSSPIKVPLMHFPIFSFIASVSCKSFLEFLMPSSLPWFLFTFTVISGYYLNLKTQSWEPQMRKNMHCLPFWVWVTSFYRISSSIYLLVKFMNLLFALQLKGFLKSVCTTFSLSIHWLKDI